MTVRAGSKPIIIDPEKAMHKKLSHSEHFVFRIDASDKDRLRDTFLVLPSSTLNKYAELLVRTMKELPNLRVLFVLTDTDFDTFFDTVTALRVNSLLSKIFRVDGAEQVDRVLYAWCEGLEGMRFADARVEGSTLIAKACDLTRYEIDLSSLPVFRDVRPGDLQKPILDQTGSRISWAKQHIDLDFDTLRYHADQKYKLERDLAALEYYPFYGEAIRELREKMHLTQEAISDKTGFSTRHLSRIEHSGQKLTAKLMHELASAHGLSLDEYIRCVIRICSEMEAVIVRKKRLLNKRKG